MPPFLAVRREACGLHACLEIGAVLLLLRGKPGISMMGYGREPVELAAHIHRLPVGTEERQIDR